MGKGILLIIIIVGVILIVAIQQNGTQGLKKPDSYIQATKTIGSDILPPLK